MLHRKTVPGALLALAAGSQVALLLGYFFHAMPTNHGVASGDVVAALGFICVFLAPYAVALLILLFSRTPFISLAVTVPWIFVHSMGLYEDYKSDGESLISSYISSPIYGVPLSLLTLSVALLLRWIFESKKK
jgi:hypothetical protein